MCQTPTNNLEGIFSRWSALFQNSNAKASFVPWVNTMKLVGKCGSNCHLGASWVYFHMCVCAHISMYIKISYKHIISYILFWTFNSYQPINNQLVEAKSSSISMQTLRNRALFPECSLHLLSLFDHGGWEVERK